MSNAEVTPAGNEKSNKTGCKGRKKGKKLFIITLAVLGGVVIGWCGALHSVGQL